MKIPKWRFLMLPLLAFSSIVALAAGLDTIPEKSLAKKKELLFSDDFSGTLHDKRWHRVVDTFAFEDGALKGSQTRVKDMSSADGKSVIKAHAAVYGLELPTKNSVVECKIRFEGATMIDVEFDDRAFTGSHYGHLCRAQIRLDKVVLLDEREGTQSNALIELRKDPVANKAEISKLLTTHSASYPATFEVGKWYTLVVETIGDEMRVTMDAKPVGYLKSPGIGHATKSKIELGVAGKDGWFDDIKVWNAEPTR
ncbi:hypothetical protein [Armatimonas sp.]|uniref:hypothetical protein n=1 Tax=Armatimonas sp. TaxID=1872638 RepID=UPI00286A38E0|nr:hypothetical protein [Armatimonas sp.]